MVSVQTWDNTFLPKPCLRQISRVFSRRDPFGTFCQSSPYFKGRYSDELLFIGTEGSLCAVKESSEWTFFHLIMRVSRILDSPPDRRAGRLKHSCPPLRFGRRAGITYLFYSLLCKPRNRQRRIKPRQGNAYSILHRNLIQNSFSIRNGSSPLR